MKRDGYLSYLDKWSKLHGGVPPRGVVGGWLRVVYACASPLAAAGISPNVITATGLGIAVLTLPFAAVGGHWPIVAVVIIVLSALMDSLDGGVAVLTGRV